ncbi:type II secretion system protein GspC [Geotalea uraniireducens]|uniref:Type II secretory pathway component PulC-like protein n=1 Tax=Geotalea uraniireducens (strain Rf4) TaxID=351605 RepID=A5GC06_GEOUR|nr:type II secretion system protein GspC [Geotalea uraniireducens]ABQ24896.1 Type II secretory pathway component PulC-like protein [Geotalea uraniireducens Rf4]
MQKWILPTNIFLTFLIIMALALISSDLISFRLTKLYPKGAKKASPPPSSSNIAEDLMSFAPILEKGLFGKATQGRLSPVVQATATKAAPTVSQGDLILLGTAVGSFRETFALVQKSSSKEERVFRLGDTVFDTGPLVAVKKEVAEILVGGRRIKILTPTAIATEAAAPQTQAAVPGEARGLASQVGVGSYVIDQRALNASLDNIGQAMTDARLLPSIKNGKVEGFRISEVKPQGIFGTIGIKNGDVLLSINDFPIDSPEKAIQSFASLKGQNRIKLDLVRDGQPTTFNYDIR